MILLNDEILAARDATKSNAVRPNAFSAPYRGDLGLAEPEGIVFHRAAPSRADFDLAAVRELPRVDIVLHVRRRRRRRHRCVRRRRREGHRRRRRWPRRDDGWSASGHRSARLPKGVVVVVGTRTGSGAVPVGEGARRNGAASTIGSGDLNPQNARVLLMLALTKTTDRKEVAKIFQANQ